MSSISAPPEKHGLPLVPGGHRSKPWLFLGGLMDNQHEVFTELLVGGTAQWTT